MRVRLYHLSFLTALLLPHLTKAQEGASILPEAINSSFEDVRPYITLNNQTLYFCRRFHPENIKGEKDFQDIWYSQKQAGGAWGKAQNLGEPINNKQANDLVYASVTGDSIIVQNARYKHMGSALVLFTRKGGQWQDPQELDITNFYNESPYVDFCYAPTHEIIIMAVARKDSYGDQDLYVSLKDPNRPGEWKKPINLGKVVNSPAPDFAPFLGSDGKTLFFASYRKGGFGNADLYVTTRLDDSWEKWSTPKNLGKTINSRNEETYLSVSADFSTVYYDSYAPEASNRDIHQAPLPEALKPKKEEPKPQEKPAAAVPVVEMTSDTTQEETKVALNDQTTATESVQEKQDPEQQNPPQPTVAPEQKEVATVEKPIQMKPAKAPQHLKNGKKTKWKSNVYFDFDKAALRSESTKTLKALTQILQTHPEWGVVLEGFTDAVGGENINKELSCNRATAVAQFLEKQGIAKDRIANKCLGEKQPLASNDDEVMGRELNRRVEIYFIKGE